MLLHVLKYLLTTISILIVLLLAYLFIGWPKTYPKEYGITWSDPYARYLGIDPLQGLEAALSDLQVKHVRIPTYWTEGERTQGVYNWSPVDKQLALIERYQGRVTLVLGAKQPRWPECWIPDWAKSLSKEERAQAQLEYVRRTIEHFKNHPVITRWQVENEPEFFASFGDCAFYDKTLLKDEIELVKQSQSDRPIPISTTASGELSTWLFEPKNVDVGFSVYRTVPNDLFKRVHYWFLPSWFYDRKIALRTFLRGGDMYVSEFQMEPWVKNDIRTASEEETTLTLDLAQMKDNLVFAERLNVKQVDFWGVEWWYWMKTQKNQPEYWEEMKKVFSQK